MTTQRREPAQGRRRLMLTPTKGRSELHRGSGSSVWLHFPPSVGLRAESVILFCT